MRELNVWNTVLWARTSPCWWFGGLGVLGYWCSLNYWGLGAAAGHKKAQLVGWASDIDI